MGLLSMIQTYIVAFLYLFVYLLQCACGFRFGFVGNRFSIATLLPNANCNIDHSHGKLSRLSARRAFTDENDISKDIVRSVASVDSLIAVLSGKGKYSDLVDNVDYLRNVIGMTDDVLLRMMGSCVEILSFPRERLRNAVATLKSQGFTQQDIRRIFSVHPKLLKYDFDIEILEKLVSLRATFLLTSPQCAEIVTKLPVLLMFSLQRYEASQRALRKIGFTLREVSRLMRQWPRLLTVSPSVIVDSWELLVNVYGYEESRARDTVTAHPRLLTGETLRHLDDRWEFLMGELGVSPLQAAQSPLLKHCPALLWLSVDRRLRPNAKLLRTLLGDYAMDETEIDTQVQRMVRTYPPLLDFAPPNLLSRWRSRMRLLTGLNATHCDDDDMLDIDDSDVEVEREVERDVEGCDEIVRDLLSDTAQSDSVCAFFHAQSNALGLTAAQATKILRTVPWLLGYTLSRSRGVLGSLALTLGMTRGELTRCVSAFPRLLCLGVEGKLLTVLQTLASAAAMDSEDEDAATENAALTSELSGWSEEERQAVLRHRNQTVRRRLRQLVVRYPYVLGTSMNLLTHKIDTWRHHRLPWSAFYTVLRRSEETQMRWQVKQTLKAKTQRMAVTVTETLTVEADELEAPWLSSTDTLHWLEQALARLQSINRRPRGLLALPGPGVKREPYDSLDWLMHRLDALTTRREGHSSSEEKPH